MPGTRPPSLDTLGKSLVRIAYLIHSQTEYGADVCPLDRLDGAPGIDELPHLQGSNAVVLEVDGHSSYCKVCGVVVVDRGSFDPDEDPRVAVWIPRWLHI